MNKEEEAIKEKSSNFLKKGKLTMITGESSNKL